MNDRAHIRKGALVRLYAGEKHSLVLSDGKTKVSPAVIGYVNGDDRIVTYTRKDVDNSTGPDTVVERTSRTVATDGVTDVYTKRDKTQAELDQEAAEDVADLDVNPVDRILATALWHTNKGTVPAAALTSPSAFLTWLKSLR